MSRIVENNNFRIVWDASPIGGNVSIIPFMRGMKDYGIGITLYEAQDLRDMLISLLNMPERKGL